VIRAALSVYRRAHLDPILWPRNAGSYPGYVFTGEPLKLPAGHFGLATQRRPRSRRYVVIESSNPKVMGWDGAGARSSTTCTSSRPSPEGCLERQPGFV